MNILFVHEIDWLRKVVFELHTLSELLSLAGHNVYAIDYESMWEKDGVFDFGTMRTTKGYASRAYKGATVELIRPGFVKIPVLSRVSAVFNYSWLIEETIKDNHIDVVILYSVPTNGLQTIKAAKKLGVPVIFRAIDNLHRLVDNRLLSKITFSMEKMIYSRVDKVLTISPQLSRYVIGMGAPEQKVGLLPLGVDTVQYHPYIKPVDSRRWGISLTDKIIMFMGTIPEFSGLDRFIPLLKRIVIKYPRVKLVIVGDGPQRSRLEHITRTVGLDGHVIITGLQPFETIPGWINLADICINTFQVKGATKDAFPTKIIQYLACGKPVVSLPLLGMKEMIKGWGEGVVYVDNMEAMADAINALLSNPFTMATVGENGHRYVTKYHSYDKVIQQLEEEIKGVL